MAANGNSVEQPNPVEQEDNHGVSDWKDFIVKEAKRQNIGNPTDVDVNTAVDFLKVATPDRLAAKFLKLEDMTLPADMEVGAKSLVRMALTSNERYYFSEQQAQTYTYAYAYT